MVSAMLRRLGAGCAAARRCPGLQARKPVRLVPVPHIVKNCNSQQRSARKPRDAGLSVGQNDERRQQRTGRRADVAAHLEHRLRQSVLASGGHPGDPRGFRMKHGRAGSDQGRRQQQQAEVACPRQQRQPHEREPHAGGERIGTRPAIRIRADDGLKKRCRDLKGEGQQPDLRVAELIRGLEHRIQRRQQRLHHVVQHVAEADGQQDAERGLRRRRNGCGAGCSRFGALGGLSSDSGFAQGMLFRYGGGMSMYPTRRPCPAHLS